MILPFCRLDENNPLLWWLVGRANSRQLLLISVRYPVLAKGIQLESSCGRADWAKLEIVLILRPVTKRTTGRVLRVNLFIPPVDSIATRINSSAMLGGAIVTVKRTMQATGWRGKYDSGLIQT